MISLSKNLLAAVLLASASSATAQLFPPADTNNLIPQWLPQCFDDQQGGNPFDVVECIRENSQPSCLQQSFQDSVMDVIQCVNVSVFDQVTAFFESINTDEVTDFFDSFTGDLQDITTATSRQGPLEDFLNDALGIDLGFDLDALSNLGASFVNASLECLDPYADCVEQTIQDAMDMELEPCINQTLRELVECGRTNSETCIDTCSNSTELDSTLFQGLDFMAVQTCQGIQSNVMDPLCSVVSCCEPCVAKMEALMQCIVNDQLDQVPAVGKTCNSLQCPPMEPSQRKLRTTSTASSTRILQAQPEKPADDCLQYSPGLTGDDGKELSARSAVFVPCVSDSFLGAVQVSATTKEEEMTTTGGTTNLASAGVRSVGLSSVGFLLALASVAL